MAKNKEIPQEERRAIRKAIRRCKELEPMFKPLLKEYEDLREFLKGKVKEYERDFSFPEGGTSTRSAGVRTSYDYKALDEMIDNGTFDADTAALILRARKEIEPVSVYLT